MWLVDIVAQYLPHIAPVEVDERLVQRRYPQSLPISALQLDIAFKPLFARHPLCSSQYSLYVNLGTLSGITSYICRNFIQVFVYDRISIPVFFGDEMFKSEDKSCREHSFYRGTLYKPHPRQAFRCYSAVLGKDGIWRKEQRWIVLH